MGSADKQIILLVDDTPENIDVLSGILREEYKVKVALNGQRALKIAETDPQPSLILLDVMMPGMDGFEVCRRLKANEKTQNIPVIFVTAKTDSGDEKAGFELGALDYIAKPIKPDVVQARVRTHVELCVARDEAERLLAENREMLQQTLIGSIRVISDLLSWANPAAFLRAARLRAFMEGVVEELELKEEGWQLNLAATLSQIGLVALPAEEMNRYSTGQGVSFKFLSLFKAQAEIGGRALGQVPRLKVVAEIIENQLKPLPAPGDYPEEIHQRDIHTLGRQLLRILTDFDHKLLGEKSSVVLQSMRNDPHYDAGLIQTLEQVIQKMEWIPCALSTGKIASGMVLDEEVVLPGRGGTLKEGTVLTQQKIDELVTLFKNSQQYRLFRVKVPFKVDQHGNLPSVKEMQALVSDEAVTEPEPESPTKGTLDLAVVKPLITDLASHLEEDDPDSKNLVTKLQTLAASTEAEDQVNQISELVNQYDFPAALELLQELGEKLKL
ncbi:MAG: response regulator [Magnetococcales bacterium]|nr:response regulator [Magnetococcales bacterium]